jgi:DNA invertase Pin-like site-specific DNA recombinase
MIEHMDIPLIRRQMAIPANTAEASRLVGYARVSTAEQTLDMQLDAMRKEGVPEELIFRDLESGRTFERHGLRLALKACRKGGTLLVWKLDRLGRNTGEIIATVNRLRERGIHFRSLTESMITSENRETAAGKLLFTIFAALAEFESDQISERTKAGQRSAKERGVLFGREPFDKKYIASGRVAQFQELWARRKAEGGTINATLAELKIPRSTYLKYRQVFLNGPIDDIGHVDADV